MAEVKTKLATIDIKGKRYTTVDSRVEFFREKFPTWSLETDFIELNLDKGVCVCRAIVRDESGKQVADGIAHEWQSKPGSMVNKTSYIENAQTSAVGRALGFIGIGINGMGIATAEEVQTAIAHQENNDYPTVQSKPTIEQQVGDSKPFAAPTPQTREWANAEIFAQMLEFCDTVDAVQDCLNQQRNNPNLQTLIPLATAKKHQIEAQGV